LPVQRKHHRGYRTKRAERRWRGAAGTNGPVPALLWTSLDRAQLTREIQVQLTCVGCWSGSH